MGTMDTKELNVKIKVPFAGTTLRLSPFQERHLVALKMAQSLKTTDSKLNVILSALADLAGQDQYAVIIQSLIEGTVDTADVTKLLQDAVEATVKLRQTQGQAPQTAGTE